MSKQMIVESQNQTLKVSIIGAINENTTFAELDLNGAKEIHLDLKQVSNLNSMGLRNWLIWVKKLKGKAQMRFQNCPRVVVEQMAILQGFLPIGAIVDSFQVPYYCDSCGHEEQFMAFRGRDYMEATADTPEGVKVPEIKPCPSCQLKMNIDIVPLKYFSFLKNRRV
jgi:anti-anti-sigma regulatory factor